MNHLSIVQDPNPYLVDLQSLANPRKTINVTRSSSDSFMEESYHFSNLSEQSDGPKEKKQNEYQDMLDEYVTFKRGKDQPHPCLIPRIINQQVDKARQVAQFKPRAHRGANVKGAKVVLERQRKESVYRGIRSHQSVMISHRLPSTLK